MKAAQINDYGDASVVKVTDIDKPTINNDQVLVEVHASSLNPFDTMVRTGYLKEAVPLQLPVTLGGDIAGIISEIGENVENLSVGDKVYGQANVVAGNSGALAEYAATSYKQVAKMPESLDFEQAASLPLVGVSAWQAIVSHINLQSGQKILINGGSGGIGTVAIQIAKHLGAYVAATAADDGLEYVKELGADEVIDYKSQDFSEILRDYDAVFDTAGGDSLDKILTILKPGGIAVSMAGQPNEDKAKELQVTAIGQSTHVTTEALTSLKELIESGVVTPHVDKVFNLDDISEAFTVRESGKVKGKVVIKISE